MFGCSITWGFPLNNEDTFPWLIQAEMPDVYIRSLAGHGYGNVQALLQLQNAIDRQTKLPAVAVFNYNPFHRERNVALPSLLRGVWANEHELVDNEASTPRPELQFAKASLNRECNFEISFIPLRPDQFAGQPDPDEFYRLEMTKTIFYRLMQLCKQHNILPIFA
jgi:hypothetical protein